MPKHRETRRACSPSGCCALALRVETAWGWTGEGNPTTLYEGGSLCPYFVLPPAARWECSVTAWFSSIIQPWQERECVSAQRHSRCTYLKKEGSRWADGALPKRPSTSQKVPEKRVKESLTCRPGELGGFPRRLCSGGRPLLPLALLLRGREPGVRRTGAARPPPAHARTHLGELPEVPQDDVCRLRADNCGGASFSMGRDGRGSAGVGGNPFDAGTRLGREGGSCGRAWRGRLAPP